MRKVCLAATLVAYSLGGFTTPVFGFSTGIDFLDFHAWDHELVSSHEGQTFENIFGDVDVTVTSIGSFDFPTAFAFRWLNMGGHARPNSHSLRFEFSEPLPLAVKTNTVDPNEIVMVYTRGEEKYCHLAGSPPIVETQIGNSRQGISVRGTAFGMDPTSGASSGEIVIEEANRSLFVTHRALADNKFERISIGVVVTAPEPGMLTMFGSGAMGLLFRWRRRQ